LQTLLHNQSSILAARLATSQPGGSVSLCACLGSGEARGCCWRYGNRWGPAKQAGLAVLYQSPAVLHVWFIQMDLGTRESKAGAWFKTSMGLRPPPLLQSMILKGSHVASHTSASDAGGGGRRDVRTSAMRGGGGGRGCAGSNCKLSMDGSWSSGGLSSGVSCDLHEYNSAPGGMLSWSAGYQTGPLKTGFPTCSILRGRSNSSRSRQQRTADQAGRDKLMPPW